MIGASTFGAILFRLWQCSSGWPGDPIDVKVCLRQRASGSELGTSTFTESWHICSMVFLPHRRRQFCRPQPRSDSSPTDACRPIFEMNINRKLSTRSRFRRSRGRVITTTWTITEFKTWGKGRSGNIVMTTSKQKTTIGDIIKWTRKHEKTKAVHETRTTETTRKWTMENRTWTNTKTMSNENKRTIMKPPTYLELNKQ